MSKDHELIIYNKKHYAEVIRSRLKKSNNISISAKSSFQFGILSHKKGFVEPPHYHRPFKRVINDFKNVYSCSKGKVKLIYIQIKNNKKNNLIKGMP